MCIELEWLKILRFLRAWFRWGGVRILRHCWLHFWQVLLQCLHALLRLSTKSADLWAHRLNSRWPLLMSANHHRPTPKEVQRFSQDRRPSPIRKLFIFSVSKPPKSSRLVFFYVLRSLALLNWVRVLSENEIFVFGVRRRNLVVKISWSCG